jgi:hypothetical protein
MHAGPSPRDPSNGLEKLVLTLLAERCPMHKGTFNGHVYMVHRAVNEHGTMVGWWQWRTASFGGFEPSLATAVNAAQEQCSLLPVKRAPEYPTVTY